MTKFEFLRKALFANESEDVAFRSVDELMKRPIVRVALESCGDKGRRIKLVRDKKHTKLIDLDKSHLKRQAAFLNDQIAVHLGNNKWMSDVSLMNRIDGVKNAHWVIDAINLYMRIGDSPDDAISEERARDVENRIVQYEKTLHVIRSFRHTHDKDFENYVVTGIWHRLRLANLEHDLKPITQQYVKREHGYALLDLYFPDIKFAVECDEAYHQGNYLNDQAREREVYKRFNEWLVDGRHFRSVVDDLDAISATGVEANSLELARVDASLPYGLIDRQLDEIVNHIKIKYRDFGCPCWDVRPAEDIVLENRKVTDNEMLVFTDIASILKGLNILKSDGIPYLYWGRGGFPIGESRILWFPHLSFAAGGWHNILSEDGNEITESRGTGHSEIDEKQRRIAQRDWHPDVEKMRNGETVERCVFAHSKNALGERGYRFLGIYKLEDAITNREDGLPEKLIFRKTQHEMSIIPDGKAYYRG